MTRKARQEAARLAEAKRIAKKALTLTYVLLRVDALSHAILKQAEMPEEALEPGLLEQAHWTTRVECTPSYRVYAYFTILLAVLYSLVEKWRQWHFADPAVDALLADGDKINRLAKYRHAVFHADYYDHQDLRSLLHDDELHLWTQQLATALRDYLRRWHQEPMTYIAGHMGNK